MLRCQIDPSRLRGVKIATIMQTILDHPQFDRQDATSELHFVFSGGTTGGHLFPGLAVVEQLRDRWPRATYTFVGAGRPLDLQWVAAANCEYLPVQCQPVSKAPLKAMRFLSNQWAGYRDSLRFLREHRVSVVVGLGGYSSAPMARAAITEHVPLVLLEQNAMPGRVTRWLSSSAQLVCAAFGEVRPRLKASGQLRVTGNPIRQRFLDEHRDSPRADSITSPRILVLGGSQGATPLNHFVPRALYKAGAHQHKWRIIHQTGDGVAETKALYRKLGIEATVSPFINSVQRVIANSDFVISRAGGTTLAELAVTATPAILVPFPHARDNHQGHNAEVFRDAGAARVVEEHPDAQRLDNALAAELTDMVQLIQRRRTMSEAMLRLARPHAARHVATMIGEIVHASQARLAG